MSKSLIEQQVIDDLVADLSAQGYEVYKNPERQICPSFFGGYRPDVLAYGSDKNIILEVKIGSNRPNGQLDEIANIIEQQNKLEGKRWEVRLVGITPDKDKLVQLTMQDIEQIKSSLDEIRVLVTQRHYGVALLQAWATFEAIARTISSDKFAKPQTPGRIIEEFASEGYITPKEAQFLRVMAQKRNTFIHGQLNIDINELETNEFLGVLKTVIDVYIEDKKKNTSQPHL